MILNMSGGGGAGLNFKVVGGTSKANRHFITCSLAEAEEEKKAKAKK